MDRRLLLLSGLGALVLTGTAQAESGGPLILVPGARKIGSARLNVMMIPVFDLTLYGPQGQWSADRPYALRLDYLREMSGQAMARHAVDEISRQGVHDPLKLKVWEAQMRALLPNVVAGDSMTAVRDAAGATHVFKGRTAIGSIADPDFTRCFFAICLGPATSRPDLRKGLLGVG